jgi:hypothetical protein
MHGPYNIKLLSSVEAVCHVNKTDYKWFDCDRILTDIVFSTRTGMFNIKFKSCGKIKEK